MAKTSIAERVSKLVTELRELNEEWARLEDWDYGSESKMYKPALDDSIEKAEVRLGIKFPPSYRVFLKLHNGWMEFWADWCLLGVNGPGYRKMQRDVDDTMNTFIEAISAEGDDYVTKLKKQEKSDPKVIYAPHHPVIATDFNGSVMVFDRNRVDADGEYQIAWVEYGDNVLNRYQSFIHLLEHAVKRIRHEIKELQEESDEN